MSSFKLFPYLRMRIDKSNLVPKSGLKLFYDANSFLFGQYHSLKDYNKISDPFSLLKADIVLEGLSNKIKIEESSALYMEANLGLASTYKAIHERMPYFVFKGEKIYVPFFSEVCNRPYDKKLNSLLKAPFSSLKDSFESEVIDPFFTYGYMTFDSLFTNLIKIGTSKQLDEAAFYSVDLEMILVIDDQGTLEESIPIYDSQLVDKRKDHLIPYLINLMKFYFDQDKEGFIDSLYNFHFISMKLYKDIIRLEGLKEER